MADSPLKAKAQANEERQLERDAAPARDPLDGSLSRPFCPVHGVWKEAISNAGGQWLCNVEGCRIPIQFPHDPKELRQLRAPSQPDTKR